MKCDIEKNEWMNLLVLNYLCNLVKFAEELIQHVHKFTWGAVAGQSGEADNVSIQNAAKQGKTVSVQYLTQGQVDMQTRGIEPAAFW